MAIWPIRLLAQAMSPTSASTSAVSPVIGLTDTIAVSVDSKHLPQRSAASSSQHPAASTVPTLMNLGSPCSSGQLARGNDSFAVVQKSVFWGVKDTDKNSVRTSSDRRKLHNYVERKAESAVRGEDGGVCSIVCYLVRGVATS